MVWTVGSARTHYVEAGVAVRRQTMAPRVVGTRIENLPIPCQLTIDGSTYTVDDGRADLTFNLPGDYVVSITPPKFLAARILVCIGP